jgi:hypothetical protein
MLQLPFTAEQFLDVFARYNLTVWPAQLVLTALGGLLVLAAARGGPRRGRLVALGLAALWLWTGMAYHLAFFSAVNPAAPLFAALTLAQAGLFVDAARRGRPIEFRPGRDWRGPAGAGLLAYALVAYPALGLALGHRYPAAPTFGLPCPTTLFTFGLLLWQRERVPPALVVLPVVWSAIGAWAAVGLGMWEDLGLAAAAVLGIAATRSPRTTRGSRITEIAAQGVPG